METHSREANPKLAGNFLVQKSFRPTKPSLHSRGWSVAGQVFGASGLAAQLSRNSRDLSVAEIPSRTVYINIARH